MLDADTIEGHGVDGIGALTALEKVHGPLPETRMARSPTGSIHYYFKWPVGIVIRNSTSRFAPGIDVRGEGGMALAPPSVRPGKKDAYRWLDERDPVDAPRWLINLIVADDEGEERKPNQDLKADPAEVAAAVAVIPNADLGWEEWNKIGMAIWARTGGTGFAAFNSWSQKSSKYQPLETFGEVAAVL